MQLFIWYFEVILIIYPENVSSLGDKPDVLGRLFHYVLSRGRGFPGRNERFSLLYSTIGHLSFHSPIDIQHRKILCPTHHNPAS